LRYTLIITERKPKDKAGLSTGGSKKLTKKIDVAAYGLYGLTEEEIGIVEGVKN
jgi:hypothetical protein